MKKLFFLIAVVLTIPYVATAQEEWPNSAGNDSMVQKYLADTLNAPAKIKELISRPEGEKKAWRDRGDAIRMYQIALTLVPYAKDSAAILARLHAGFATELFHAGAVDLAIQYLHTALAYHRKVVPLPDSDSYNLLGKIGSYYLRSDRLDSAAHYYNLTVMEAKQIKNPLWISAAYNNQGILFTKLGKNNDALASFQKALQELVFRDRGDSLLKGSITDNLAELAVDENDLEDAMAFYYANLDLYTRLNSRNDLYKTYAGLADVFIKQAKWAEANEQLQQMLQLINEPNSEVTIDRRIRYHDLLKTMHEAQKNWKVYADEQEQVSFLQDSINRFNSKQLNGLLQALTQSQIFQFRKDIQLHQLQLAQARMEARRNRVIGIMGGILALTIMSLLYLYYSDRNKRQKDKISLQQKDRQLAEAELRNRQLEQEQLQKKLDYKKQDISDMALYLTKLKDLNDTMLEKLEELKQTKPEDQKAAIKTMVNELGAMIHSQEKISMMQENLDVVNKEFIAKLLEAYPDLTKSEIELCGFFRMNMSNKEIGLLKNISPQSVKMARYRLRKKFALDSETDINRFLAGM